jgi:hypothetical protein
MKPLFLKTAVSEEQARVRDEEAASAQREWFLEAADAVAAGRLPEDALGRQLIAAVLRHAAQNVAVPEPLPRRGNPDFKRRVYDEDLVALQVGMRLRNGRSQADAGYEVGEMFGIDESTALKAFRARRAAVEEVIGPIHDQ